MGKKITHRQLIADKFLRGASQRQHIGRQVCTRQTCRVNECAPHGIHSNSRPYGTGWKIRLFGVVSLASVW